MFDKPTLTIYVFLPPGNLNILNTPYTISIGVTSMVDAKVLGANIRAERKRQLLTLEQLAEQVGITDNFLGKIERGDSMPSLQTIERIARTLDVSIDFLLENSDQSNNPQRLFYMLELNKLTPDQQKKFTVFLRDTIKYFK